MRPSKRWATAAATAATVALSVAAFPATAAADDDTVTVKIDSLRWDWQPNFLAYYIGDRTCPDGGRFSGSPQNQGPVQWCSFPKTDSSEYQLETDCGVTVTSPRGFSWPVRKTSVSIRKTFLGNLESMGWSELGCTADEGRTDLIHVRHELTEVDGRYVWKVFLDDSAVPSADAERTLTAQRSSVVEAATAKVNSEDCQQVFLEDGDVFEGTPGSDCVKATVEAGSSASIKTGGGEDTISVNVPDGSSVDIAAGASNDTVVVTGDGDATVRGGHGDDTITTDNGEDSITGGPGTDMAVGAGGQDDLDSSVEFAAQEKLTVPAVPDGDEAGSQAAE